MFWNEHDGNIKVSFNQSYAVMKLWNIFVVYVVSIQIWITFRFQIIFPRQLAIIRFFSIENQLVEPPIPQLWLPTFHNKYLSLPNI